MDKKRIIFISIIAIFIAIVGLYSTYAINVYEEETTSTNYDMAFDFSLSGNDNKEIIIASGKKQLLDIDITNPYNDTVQYGVAYSLISPSTLPENVIIAESSMSKNSTIGLVEANETKSISLVIVNNSTESITVSFSVINGYKNGGDLIVEEGKKLIDEVYQVNPPNEPALTDNLVPVYYDEEIGTWKTANYDNKNNQWYNYSEKKWANAVLLTETKRNDMTKDANGNYVPDQVVGDTEESGTLAFYVWIPRYKYKVWNKDKVIGTDSYDAYNTGIDIIFEHGTNTTGTIECNYDFTKVATETVRNEECTGSNGDYYTHPAFTFGEDELTGFWMGKFELSSVGGTIDNVGGSIDTSTAAFATNISPLILPNVISWRFSPIDIYWKNINDINSNSNIYGLNYDKTSIDSHMITNLEWGAVVYLSHSKYGTCGNGICQDIGINNSGKKLEYTFKFNDRSIINSVIYTGRSKGDFFETSGDNYSLYGTYTYDGRVINSDDGAIGLYDKNNILLGSKASTTGNIYGVYDMSGGSNCFTMGSISNSSNSFVFNSNYSDYEFENFIYTGNEKYLTAYAYGTTNKDQTAYNRTRLGDALGEVIVDLNTFGWYGNYIGFLRYNNSNGKLYQWLARGGDYNVDSYHGVFDTAPTYGVYATNSSTYAILAVFDK